MTTLPQSAIEDVLIERLRRGSQVRPPVMMLRGAIFLGSAITLLIAFAGALIRDSGPDFGNAAAIGIPLGALFALAVRLIVQRVLRTRGITSGTPTHHRSDLT